MNALANLYRKDKAALLLAASSSTTPRSVRNLLHTLCRMTDDTLRTLWDATGFDPGLCLVAVGGYGRAELAPQSDIDLLFVRPYKSNPRIEQLVEMLARGETIHPQRKT